MSDNTETVLVWVGVPNGSGGNYKYRFRMEKPEDWDEIDKWDKEEAINELATELALYQCGVCDD